MINFVLHILLISFLAIKIKSRIKRGLIIFGYYIAFVLIYYFDIFSKTTEKAQTRGKKGLCSYKFENYSFFSDLPGVVAFRSCYQLHQFKRKNKCLLLCSHVFVSAMYVVRRFLPWRPYEEANLIDPEDLSIQGKLFLFVRSCEFEIFICEQK